MATIGFKTTAQRKEETLPKKQEEQEVDAFTASQLLGKSMAHVQVMNRINQIAADIVSDEFLELSQEIRTNYVQSLIDQVSLNAELNTKNEILKG